MKKQYFYTLIVGLFLFRLGFGLCSEFWFEDELQIYLIGLKSFTTKTLPLYGPDVVYTNTQIPGALQGLLVSMGFYILPIPEMPTIMLNIMTFLSLAFLANYLTKRITNIPTWLIWSWIMLLTWTMNFGTRVTNPSYVLIFSIPFFISVIELIKIYDKPLINSSLAYFLLGICPMCLMQLHLSFILLFPFMGLVFFNLFFKNKLTLSEKTKQIGYFLIGSFVGLSTLIPTWLYGGNVKNVASNVVFNTDNFKNIATILARYLSYGSHEIPYILGANTQERLGVIKESWWMAPFSAFLLIFGLALVAFFVFVFIKNKASGTWQRLKYLTIFGYAMVFLSFFFSVKGPASHTFCIMTPLVIIYSFHCHEWLWERFKFWKPLMIATVICAVFFYIGLGKYNFYHKSLYKNRAQAAKAIEQHDYKILGTRRADQWGYGY